MGWRDWFGSRGGPMLDGSPVLVLREAAIAATLPRPEQHGLDHTDACEKCGKAPTPCLITTGSELGDPEVWDAAPIAVDGWACLPCGTLRYPRALAVEESVRYGQRGVEAARAKRYRDAEWWFTRIAWGWPTYAAAQLDLANVLRERASAETTPLARSRVLRRAQNAYDAAISLGERESERTPPALRAAAHVGAAELAAEDRAAERALRAIDGLRALPNVAPDALARAAEIERYVLEERWVFADASATLSPHFHLQGRRGAPIADGPTRSACARAVEQLDAYHEAHPLHWQSIWCAAMGRAALGEHERALSTWRRAAAAHPERLDIVREAVLALLRAGQNEEARTLNRDAVQRMPRDASLRANLAITELLSGDLGAANRCVVESLAIDPNDRITLALAQRLSKLRPEGPLPKTLAELEGRAR